VNSAGALTRGAGESNCQRLDDTPTSSANTRILSGAADRNIRFADLRAVLVALGFEERIRGSHHIFTRDGVAEILNLQPRDGGLAKPYQVRQVRDVIVSHRLAEAATDE
jgi:hypothetical protein